MTENDKAKKRLKDHLRKAKNDVYKEQIKMVLEKVTIYNSSHNEVTVEKLKEDYPYVSRTNLIKAEELLNTRIKVSKSQLSKAINVNYGIVKSILEENPSLDNELERLNRTSRISDLDLLKKIINAKIINEE